MTVIESIGWTVLKKRKTPGFYTNSNKFQFSFSVFVMGIM